MTSRILRMNNIRRDKTICGFTLIELLLVLVLIAITTAVITPQIGRSFPAWQMREDSKNMLTALRLTRQSATARQETMVFLMDVNNGSFAVENLIPKQFLGRGVKISGLEGFEQIDNQQGLVFWPDGRTATARIALSVDGSIGSSEYNISIEDNGSVALQEIFGSE